MIKRSLSLPKTGMESFFLWGPRQTGKTTLPGAAYPNALWIDLLKAEEYRRYLQNPELLRAEVAAQKSVRQVVIDEVQKVPQLLDEAHWLHENRGVRALCGSNARKGETRPGQSARRTGGALCAARLDRWRANPHALIDEVHSLLTFAIAAQSVRINSLQPYGFDSETVRSGGRTLTVVGRNEQVCRPRRGTGDM